MATRVLGVPSLAASRNLGAINQQSKACCAHTAHGEWTAGAPSGDLGMPLVLPGGCWGGQASGRFLWGQSRRWWQWLCPADSLGPNHGFTFCSAW